MPTDRVDFIDVAYDPLTFDQVVERLGRVTRDTPYGYLVTPNVDHVVRLEKSSGSLPQLRDIYAEADLCVCDSRVLSRLARLHGIDLPVVPGSDLTHHLLDHVVEAGDRIAIVGGDADLLEGLRTRYPAVEFVQHLPPMGLVRNPAARQQAAAFIARQRPRFTFIAVGSPQQELIAAETRLEPGATGMALCIGAALEFVTGHQVRAPRVVQELGLEWAHRLVSAPGRMWRRYLVEGPRIFVLAARWRRQAAR
ncbi:WecB/TagA/CpsF family glycosyltransferase [Sphingomonas arenae]|uniref:WecB/TagA/CpsF family glycosyltransferase n=1 Tax=Sphingomonas arenae TaxID=2812555 RepID=UPI001966D5A2|nr:WecB/TagA/CpsF family glycosyltransferase [Sphingomonas arenae]